MDIFLRVIAIIIEVGILAGIMYALLKGVKLTLFHLGVGLKYNKVVTMAMLLIGALVVIFFIAHLTAFYPEIGG